MGLLSFLKRQPAAAGDPPDPADAVQRARTQARRRLIGAVVLLGVGVVGFPLLFETQPRPIPVDLPIEIPRKDGAPALPVPSAKPARPSATGQDSAVMTERADEAGREVPPPKPSESRTPAAEAPKEPAREAHREPPREPAKEPVKEPARAEAPKPEPAKPAREDADRARALLEGRGSAAADAAKADAAKAADAASARFVVQVGAFAEATAAREARSKVERLGLKTYTQVVETGSGPRTRVRVGPFASRDEADKASARIKSAGLTAAVLTL